MIRKTGYKKHNMDAKWFAQIKSLLDLNLKNRQIQEILKVSSGTLCAVKRAPTFEAYKTDQKDRQEMRIAKRSTPVSKEPIASASSKIETPIYDVLIEIRNKITETNYLLAQAGKSKGFRLF